MSEQNVAKVGSRVTGMLTKSKLGGKKFFKKLIIVAVVVVIIGGGFYLITRNSEAAINHYSGNQWQAVFLTNGQVYFGHVTKITKRSVVLENIYYLQVITRPLQRSQEGTEAAASAQGQQEEQRLTLIKLGNEIHGPNDRMNINRDHVVLVENLKDDSRVVEAITTYITGQQAQ